MSARAGFNPLHYNCDQQGCFNKKHRLKFGVFYDSLPGKISFTDVDGITEVAGNALMIEWKSSPVQLPYGQSTMFKRMTLGQMISVICVAGDASTMTATHIAKIWDGKIGPWKPATIEDLNKSIKSWANWSMSNPRWGGARK